MNDVFASERWEVASLAHLEVGEGFEAEGGAPIDRLSQVSRSTESGEFVSTSESAQ